MEEKELFDCDYLNGEMFQDFIISGASKLNSNIKEINDLNVFPIPDGDTGDNMYRTINGGIAKMKETDSKSLEDKANSLASGMLFNARGNSGVILSQLFYGIASGFKGISVAKIPDILNAISLGVKRAYQAVLPPVEGTILTVARVSYERTLTETNEQLSIGELANIFIKNMYKALEETPEQLPILKEAGVIDSGGAGLYMIATGILDCINGKGNLVLEESNSNQVQELDFSLFTEDSKLVYGYCTEVLLRLTNSKVDVKNFNEQVIIDYLNTIGDSLVCFKTDSIVKIHVHVMEPYKVLEFCQKFGEFLTIKIENMTLQHNEHNITKEEVQSDALPSAKKAKVKYACISVGDGEGIINLFKELGVDKVIDGGQGNNPSVNTFIDAFKEVNADNIFVFPNNSNIILAANQAKVIYKGSNIFVIESKNIGEAYSALSMLDYSIEDPNELYNLFKDNLNGAISALICKATRPVTLNNIEVNKDDYISMIGKKLISSDINIINTIDKLLASIKEKEIVTIFYGKNVDLDKQEEIKELFNNKYPELEMYDYWGKQETFDVILIIE